MPFFAFSQTHELRLGITSGFSNFTGDGSVAKSTLNGTDAESYYTNNPFGEKRGVNLGGAINYRYIFSSNFLLGLEGAFERLQTKVDLEGDGFLNDNRGLTKLNQQFLNVNPFFGYRFSFEPMTMDVQLGMDIAKTLSIREKGSVETNQGKQTDFEYNRGSDLMKLDLRPRLQFNVNYDRYTVFAGYAWGMKDYTSNMIGSPSTDARLRVFRFGLQYQLLPPVAK
ncbi:hypothetical protein LZQ00_06200 [Sphingobacterium sp. SRCM116780]|uniref:hypothetical protein n=1 Tax=Sphingobacterium sp. SRCM116780 TaxID=2907623 RepID=UPI001F2D9D43|nr:hypothetical protein [Sphingobacterium sp. SRCM116780]UIR57405.1 hypothetical protein LZQ00_06200 [Sphingobacterium sp. SRCM116780]